MKLGMAVLFFFLGICLIIGCTEKIDRSYTLTEPGACTDEFGQLGPAANSEGTDKGSAGHNYTELYEKFFVPLRSQSLRILEIGVAHGASLRLWQSYFPSAMIFGIDIDDKTAHDTERIKTFIADQGDRVRLQAFVDTHGSNFDIVLDDGGHWWHQQQISFGFLFQHVKPGGYYIIEDVHTSIEKWYPGYGGAGADKNNSTLSMLFRFIGGETMDGIYFTADEMAHLNNEIKHCFVWRQSKSLMAICKKKSS